MSLQYGDPDGHGTYGQLTIGDDGGLICHECGQERQFLGRHVREHDGMSADQYRQAHGLGRRTPLASPRLCDTFSAKAAERVGSPQWKRFEAARDPDSARQESRQVLRGPRRAQTLQLRREQALAASRSRVRKCEIDGCGRKHVTDGLCRTHYARRQRTGDVQADVPVRPRQGGPR